MFKAICMGLVAACGIMCLVAAATSEQPLESMMKTADVSLEPPLLYAPRGETVTVCVEVTGEEVPLGAVDTLFGWNPKALRLMTDDTEAVGEWFVADFLNQPDGINDDIDDGEALFTLLGHMPGEGTRMYAVPWGEEILCLTFLVLAPGEVWLIPESGRFGLTRVMPPDPPNLNLTGSNDSVMEVRTCGPQRKLRRLLE
jgi:hypothetical protein